MLVIREENIGYDKMHIKTYSNITTFIQECISIQTAVQQCKLKLLLQLT